MLMTFPTLSTHLAALSPESVPLLTPIAAAACELSATLRAASFHNLLGSTGEINVQGEVVQQLDDQANTLWKRHLTASAQFRLLASEEEAEALLLPNQGGYAVLFDPLDGSSNVAINGPLGSIFAVLQREEPEAPPEPTELLRPGRQLALAGYVLYGPATHLVLGLPGRVDGFVLHEETGEFLLTDPLLRVPLRGETYACNEGNRARWAPGLQRWCHWLKEKTPGERHPTTQRYAGALVADAHRIFHQGGIFAYPADTRSPRGKLRLLYEANPMAFLCAQAGGLATDGTSPILDLLPSSIHQRTPLVFGSQDDVLDLLRFTQA